VATVSATVASPLGAAVPPPRPPADDCDDAVSAALVVDAGGELTTRLVTAVADRRVTSRTELTADVVTETAELPVATARVTTACVTAVAEVTACVTAVAVFVVRVTADATAAVVVPTDVRAS
jgi:hypothetical protein